MFNEIENRKNSYIAQIERAIKAVRRSGDSRYVKMIVDDWGEEVEIRISDHAREFEGFASSKFGTPDVNLIIATPDTAKWIGHDFEKNEYDKVGTFSTMIGTAVLIPGAHAKKVASQIVNSFIR
jgi:hypothetical protein